MAAMLRNDATVNGGHRAALDPDSHPAIHPTFVVRNDRASAPHQGNASPVVVLQQVPGDRDRRIRRHSNPGYTQIVLDHVVGDCRRRIGRNQNANDRPVFDDVSGDLGGRTEDDGDVLSPVGA